MNLDAKPLFDAIAAGDLESVRRLVDANPEWAAARDDQGVSAALQARYRGRTDIADVLVAAGHALDVFDAAAAGRTGEVSRLLDDDPRLMAAHSGDGFTALHFAAFFDRPAVARLLLERGADPDAVAANPMRVRPLHSATAVRAAAIVHLLLEHGADVNATQHGEWTPLMAAAANGDLDSVRALLARGADTSARNAEGKTAADLARDRGQAAAAALLPPTA